MEINDISWESIFKSISSFKNNRDYIISNKTTLRYWQQFILKLKRIESTIPTYSYFQYGIDDHTNWLVRVFRMFGRAYLEELEVISSTKGKYLGITWADDRSRYFREGIGEALPDLVDKNFIYYDVKHDSNNFEKAHAAQYILNYQLGGHVLIINQNNSIELFDICSSISDLEKKYDLPEHFFSMSQAELENYFGVNL